MIAKFSVVAVLSFSVAAFPMQQARAQDGIVGGIIGGIIGGAIANWQRSFATLQRVVRYSGKICVPRAGRPFRCDPALRSIFRMECWARADWCFWGRGSRSSVFSQYQVFAGFFSGTGHAKRFERNILLTAKSARPNHGRTDRWRRQCPSHRSGDSRDDLGCARRRCRAAARRQ